MGYIKDLDEYTDEELQKELTRRQTVRDEGICDYCGRDGRMETCRYQERHTQAGVIAQRLAKIKAGIPVIGTTIIRKPTGL